jgi:opacity protein-like surface antigen
MRGLEDHMYVHRASFVLALAVAALVPPSARAAATAAAQPATARGPNHWALLVGVEDGAGDSGLQLRADLEFVQRSLSPTVGFSIVASVGYSHFSDGYTDFFTGQSVDRSLNLFKLIPAARLTFGHSAIRPYVDAGLGLYYGSFDWQYRDTLTGASSHSDDSSIGIMMRLAGGVNFQVSPAFALGVELGFQPYFADVPDDTFTSLLASATFRM